VKSKKSSGPSGKTCDVKGGRNSLSSKSSQEGLDRSARHSRGREKGGNPSKGLSRESKGLFASKRLLGKIIQENSPKRKGFGKSAM